KRGPLASDQAARKQRNQTSQRIDDDADDAADHAASLDRPDRADEPEDRKQREVEVEYERHDDADDPETDRPGRWSTELLHEADASTCGHCPRHARGHLLRAAPGRRPGALRGA